MEIPAITSEELIMMANDHINAMEDFDEELSKFKREVKENPLHSSDVVAFNERLRLFLREKLRLDNRTERFIQALIWKLKAQGENLDGTVVSKDDKSGREVCEVRLVPDEKDDESDAVIHEVRLTDTEGCEDEEVLEE